MIKINIIEWLRLKEIEKKHNGFLKGILKELEKDEIDVKFLKQVCKINLGNYEKSNISN